MKDWTGNSKKGLNAMSYAWFIGQERFSGEPVVRWID